LSFPNGRNTDPLFLSYDTEKVALKVTATIADRSLINSEPVDTASSVTAAL